MNTSAGTLGRSMLSGGGLISILAEKNAEPAVSAAALHGIGVPPAVTNKSKEMGGQEREEASIVLLSINPLFHIPQSSIQLFRLSDCQCSSLDLYSRVAQGCPLLPVPARPLFS